jgi:hypothetical protein
MKLRAIRLAAVLIGCAVALSLATAAPVHAQYYRWPPPPLPGPPYPYGPSYPYAYGLGYSGCPAGYTSIRGDICEPYFPLMGGAPRKLDGCPAHYKLYGAICKPTR